MHLFESTSWYHLKNVTYKQNQKKKKKNKKKKKKKKKERRERAQLFQSKMLNLLLNE
jgi:ribosomal protein S25